MADRTDQTTAEPQPGGVYFATEKSSLRTGQPGIFVRFEKRPGADEREALVVVARHRNVFSAWCPADRFEDEWTEAYAAPVETEPLGSAWKLEVRAAQRERDEIAEQLAAALSRQSADPGVEAERDALAAVMKEAVKRSPEHRADLVAMYRRLKGASS